MYIDEVGNSDMGSSADPNHRFLSLTGVVFGYDYVKEEVHPALESLKSKYFASHPDSPIILHRKELLRGKYPFRSLQDPKTRQRFDDELLALLKRLEYTVITVAIDKLEHSTRYKAWRFDPYHYCLQVLVERYVEWLSEKGGIGDLMAESRGGKDDRRLKKSFKKTCEDGTGFVKPESIAERLTSKELKVQPKSMNVAGLQVADLIAHPSYRHVWSLNSGEELTAEFGRKVVQVLREYKYRRSPSGEVSGWGIKWLP